LARLSRIIRGQHHPTATAYSPACQTSVISNNLAIAPRAPAGHEENWIREANRELLAWSNDAKLVVRSIEHALAVRLTLQIRSGQRSWHKPPPLPPSSASGCWEDSKKTLCTMNHKQGIACGRISTALPLEIDLSSNIARIKVIQVRANCTAQKFFGPLELP